MGKLILESLEVQNFRGFHHLQIERLGRVNLIVGKNNVGKTSLLEALQLYANDGSPSLMWQFLYGRDETSYIRSRRMGDDESLLADLKYLFYGRKDIKASFNPISIGPVNSSDDTLSISINWYVMEVGEDGVAKRRLLRPEEYDIVDNPVPRFNISAKRRQRTYPIRPTSLIRLRSTKSNCISIASNGLGSELVGELWDRIALSDLEEEVLAALKIIAPGVERLIFAGQLSLSLHEVESIGVGERVRIPVVKVEGFYEPIPLRSLGDGMQRILSIALALVNAKDGFLLIDEFENGLYYAVQPAVWRLVFRIAERLNVQVFATTHSWDCIESFQQAAQESSQEGLLIRLQRKRDEIATTLYDEEELAIVTREQIEVR